MRRDSSKFFCSKAIISSFLALSHPSIFFRRMLISYLNDSLLTVTSFLRDDYIWSCLADSDSFMDSSESWDYSSRIFAYSLGHLRQGVSCLPAGICPRESLLCFVACSRAFLTFSFSVRIRSFYILLRYPSWRAASSAPCSCPMANLADASFWAITCRNPSFSLRRMATSRRSCPISSSVS